MPTSKISSPLGSPTARMLYSGSLAFQLRRYGFGAMFLVFQFRIFSNFPVLCLVPFVKMTVIESTFVILIIAAFPIRNRVNISKPFLMILFLVYVGLSKTARN